MLTFVKLNMLPPVLFIVSPQHSVHVPIYVGANMVIEGIGIRKPSDGLKRQKSISSISSRPTDVKKPQNQKTKPFKKAISEESLIHSSSSVAKATNLEEMQRKLAGIAFSTDAIEPVNIPKFRLPKYKKSKSKNSKWTSLSISRDFRDMLSKEGLLVHEEMKMKVDCLQKQQATVESENNSNNNNRGECHIGGYSVQVCNRSYGKAWPKRELGVHFKIPHVGKYSIKQHRKPRRTLAEYRKQLKNKNVNLHEGHDYIGSSV